MNVQEILLPNKYAFGWDVYCGTSNGNMDLSAVIVMNKVTVILCSLCTSDIFCDIALMLKDFRSCTLCRIPDSPGWERGICRSLCKHKRITRV